MGQLKTNFQGKKKIRNMDKMKQICVLILAMALITADAAPSPRRIILNSSCRCSRGQPWCCRRSGRSVESTKIIPGIVGYQQLQQAGRGLVGLGVASSHYLGRKK